MKSEKEIRDLLYRLIQLSVVCSDECKQETYLEKAHLLGWIIGCDKEEIDILFDAEMKLRYGGNQDE